MMSRTRLTAAYLAFLAAASCLLLAGCGGGKDAAPAPITPPGGAAAPIRSAAPAAPVQPAAKAAAPKAATTPAAPAIEAEPGTLFEVVGEGPTYDIVGTVPNHQGELLAAISPSGSGDSSSFEIVQAPPAPKTGRPNSAFKLPEGFSAVPEAGYSDDGLPLRIVGDRDGGLMALIPAGVSVLGSNTGPTESQPEVPTYLDPFYMDVTEVTLERYGRLVAQRKDAGVSPPQIPSNSGSPATHPATGISYSGAHAFAKWSGKDLPTEAEWEKAVRGPGNFAHPWGNDRAVWPRTRTREQLDPVNDFRTDISAYGVIDLAGNAREWCLDWFSSEGHKDAVAAAKGSELRGWKGARRPSAEGLRVVKGNGPNWTVWERMGVAERDKPNTVGFRCVLRVTLPGAAPPPAAATAAPL